MSRESTKKALQDGVKKIVERRKKSAFSEVKSYIHVSTLNGNDIIMAIESAEEILKRIKQAQTPFILIRDQNNNSHLIRVANIDRVC